MSKSTQIATLGDDSILDLHKVGFLSSRKIPQAPWLDLSVVIQT